MKSDLKWMRKEEEKHRADWELYNIHLWRALSCFFFTTLLLYSLSLSFCEGCKWMREAEERRLWNSQIPSTYQASLFALITREYNCRGCFCATNIILKIQANEKERSYGEGWKECFCYCASSEWQCWRRKKQQANNKGKYHRACLKRHRERSQQTQLGCKTRPVG